MNVPRIFTKRWFWVGVILLFLFAIIWDITLAVLILTKSLSSGQWSNTLLFLGLLYCSTVLYRRYLPKDQQKQVKWGGRIVLLVIAFLTFQDYGFLKMLYFLATVFIFARFMGWTLNFFMRMYRRRKRLEV